MELYAIRFGENFIYANYGTLYKQAKNLNEKAPGFIFLYYLAKYNDKVILFDTGFRDKITAENMGITLIDVKDEIKNIVDDPFCIDTIFITHSHFDHIDNIDLYKNSSIIISKLEYDIAMNESRIQVKTQLKSNHVILVEDEYIFDHKFRFKVIGGHTPGSSVIYFEENNKNYVITGDECYACDNMLNNIPIGISSDGQKNEKFIADGHNQRLIPLPYHDNMVFSTYKQISKNVTRII